MNIGEHWRALESTGERWRALESAGEHWRALGSTGEHWRELESIGEHWGALESTGKHWRALGSTGEHWRALESTGEHLLVHHPYRTRAGIHEHALTEQSSPADDTGGENKSGLPTRHSHNDSFSDNACQKTLSQSVQRLWPWDRSHKGNRSSDPPLGRASLRPAGRNKLGQV